MNLSNLTTGFKFQIQFNLSSRLIYRHWAYAWITINDWELQKYLGEYSFSIEYVGRNTNDVIQTAEEAGKYEGDEFVNKNYDTTGDGIADLVPGNIVVKPKTTETGSVPADSAQLPKYDDEGNLYTYVLRESGYFGNSDAAADDETGDGRDYVFTQPIMNNFAITNAYTPVKGEINVRKVIDTSVYNKEELTEIEAENPSISFRLERYYKDTENPNEWVLDKDYSATKTIQWKAFVDDEAQIKFTDLEIYAPNGNRYKYVVIENPDENHLIDGGYKVYAAVGNVDVPVGEDTLISPTGDGEYILDQDGLPIYPKVVNNSLLDKIGSFFRGIGETIGIVPRMTGVETNIATFKNVYTKEYAPLEFSKTWNDDDGSNLRFATSLKFDLSYTNPGQEGQGNVWTNYVKAGSITLDMSKAVISGDRMKATITLDPDKDIAYAFDNAENPLKTVKTVIMHIPERKQHLYL